MISVLKITKGNNSAKRYNFHTNHIQNFKGALNRKNVEGVAIHNLSGHTFICTKFREIISNGIKVIERTRFLCRKLKKENNSAKNVGGVTIFILCKLAGHALHLF